MGNAVSLLHVWAGAIVLGACGAAAPPSAQQPPQTLTGDLAEFCGQFRAEIAEIDDEQNAAAEGRPFRGWPLILPGMQPLETRPASEAITGALLGAPCAGGDDLWALRADRLRGHVNAIEAEILAVTAPGFIDMGEGRSIFAAFASEGHYHAADAVAVAAFVDERNPEATPLFALPGGGAWGEAPSLNVPVQQPAGAWHLWSVAGDISFGDAEGWAGVADLAGPAPRELGRFPTYGRHSCLEADATQTCSGAWESTVTTISYGPDASLTLRWRLDQFDQSPSGDPWRPNRSNVRSRDLSADYALRDGSYQRVRGEEPPRI